MSSMEGGNINLFSVAPSTPLTFSPYLWSRSVNSTRNLLIPFHLSHDSPHLFLPSSVANHKCSKLSLFFDIQCPTTMTTPSALSSYPSCQCSDNFTCPPVIYYGISSIYSLYLSVSMCPSHLIPQYVTVYMYASFFPTLFPSDIPQTLLIVMVTLVYRKFHTRVHNARTHSFIVSGHTNSATKCMDSIVIIVTRRVNRRINTL